MKNPTEKSGFNLHLKKSNFVEKLSLYHKGYNKLFVFRFDKIADVFKDYVVRNLSCKCEFVC